MGFTGMMAPTAGLKLNDNVITTSFIGDAKLKSQTYCTATLESSTPQVREVFQRLLNDTLNEQSRWAQLSVQQGWYDAYADPTTLIRQAVTQAMPALK